MKKITKSEARTALYALTNLIDSKLPNEAEHDEYDRAEAASNAAILRMFIVQQK